MFSKNGNFYLNLFQRNSTFAVTIIMTTAIVMMLGGCGSQQANNDIAPIDSQSQAVATKAPPSPTAKLVAPESPISPISPISAGNTADMISTTPLTGSEKALAAAVANLAEKANVPAQEINLVSMEAMEWNDSSLGCPQEGYMYAQVITPGYLIVLEAGGQQYTYHTDQETTVVLCKK